MSTQESPHASLRSRLRPRGRRRIAWGTAAVVVLVVGLGLARFVSAGNDPAPGAPTPVTLADRIADLEQQTTEDPQDLRGWQALGEAYLQRAVASGDPAFYSLASRAFDRADDIRPDAPATLVGRGTLALSLHDFARGRELGQQAREALPASAAPLGILVDAEVELGRYEAAAEDLQAMVDIRPGLSSLSRVSYLRQLNGDRPGAITAMRDAEQAGAGTAFDVARTAALLGDLHLDTVEAARGDVDDAIERLRDVTAQQPQPAALTLLAELQDLDGRGEAADETADLVRSIAQLQEAAGQTVALEMAVFEADRGDDADRAIELAEAAYDARPDNVFVADARAWALHRAGRSEEALPYVEQAVRLDTADPLLHYHAAEVLAATGDQAAARQHLSRTAESPWFSFAHLDEAGRLADELGVDAPNAWSSS